MLNFSIIIKVVLGIFSIVILFLILIAVFAQEESTTLVPRSYPQPVSKPVVKDNSRVTSYSGETEKQYKKSCMLVTFNENDKGLYYKEFLKNPDKYKGERIDLIAKIMSIEEENDKTWIQAYLSKTSFDSVLIFYDGVLKIYQGDIIQVWGEGSGAIDGKNRLGVDMSWPRITAQYIKKIRSDD